VKRSYDMLFTLVLPMFVIAAIMWVANLFVPHNGWWILLKMFTEDWSVIGGLALFFAFLTLILILGSYVKMPVRNTLLPSYLILVGALGGVVGFIVTVILGGDSRWAIYPLFGGVSILFLSLTIACFLTGVIDGDVARRVRAAIDHQMRVIPYGKLLLLIRRHPPGDPNLN
jgi:hypothetical protein